MFRLNPALGQSQTLTSPSGRWVIRFDRRLPSEAHLTVVRSRYPPDETPVVAMSSEAPEMCGLFVENHRDGHDYLLISTHFGFTAVMQLDGERLRRSLPQTVVSSPGDFVKAWRVSEDQCCLAVEIGNKVHGPRVEAYTFFSPMAGPRRYMVSAEYVNIGDERWESLEDIPLYREDHNANRQLSRFRL